MSFVRLLGRRHSRLAALVVFAVCVLLLLPTPRHEITAGLASLSPLIGAGRAGRAGRLPAFADADADVIPLINPLIGTVNGGHAFPGASLPYGMAKAGADTDSRAENAAGFVSDYSKIIGFSHLHDSGTGGSPSMGNFPLFVHPGCPADDFQQCDYMPINRGVARRNGTARASPGYFALGLNNSVSAEMTATQHAALYRFTFDVQDVGERVWSAGQYVPLSPLVILDLADLANSRAMGRVQVDPDTGRVVGDGVYAPSFGTGRYSAFVCADFAGARIRNTGVFAAATATDEQNAFDFTGNDQTAPIHRTHGSAGAWIQFEPPSAAETDYSIDVRVGVSFISTERACANAESEIPVVDATTAGGWDFDGTVLAAQDAWRDKLAPIQVDAAGVSVAMQTTFWSGLYRTLLSPQNYTGENQKWTSDEPYYDSFYCIWDSFRAQHPLLTIIDPAAQTEMVRALLDIYRHDGKLPDCRMSFCKGFTQGGSNADVVIADAFVKNLTDGIDWATAYAAVVSDAEDEPSVWGVEGRGNLESYHALGYIPWDDTDVNGTGPFTRTISRLVEYAYDDFAIALLAKGLGADASLLAGSPDAFISNHNLDRDYAKYHARGANWKNLWNADQRDVYRDAPAAGSDADADADAASAFVGFLQPRLANGSFTHHSTRRCSPVFDMHSCYYDTRYDTYEGSPWLYSFYAPQDMRALVALMGGRATFAQRLHYFHASGIAYMGNEQTFLPVYQFHYAGRPGLSSYWAHEYVPGLFNASINGIPGNDDCAMGAFSAFVYMGFFPVAGQNVYLLSPPFFREVRIRAARDAQAAAVFRVVNFDPTYGSKYIQSVTLDGRPYTRSWITHDIFLYGGVLEFTVGPEESATWGTADEDLPPSYYD